MISNRLADARVTTQSPILASIPVRLHARLDAGAQQSVAGFLTIRSACRGGAAVQSSVTRGVEVLAERAMSPVAST